ncbi:MAG: DUF4340 domain-containing protein [Nitrospirales bacterium]
MKTKTIGILAGLTLIGTLVAALVTREPVTQTPQSGEPVFPQLMSVINDVSEILVETKEHIITLVRREGEWGVKEKMGYRADVEKVKSALVGLAELRLQDPKTKNPELYDRLGLLSKEKDGSTSLTISVKTGESTPIAQVVIGNQKPAKSNPRLSEIYIRKPDDPQAWLVTGNLRLDRLPEEWLDKEITALPTKRVRHVQVTHPDKEVLDLSKEKPEDMDFQLDSIPTGYKVSSTFNLNNVVGTLVQLSLEDVRKESEMKFSADTGVKAMVETFDGLRFHVQTAKEGEKVFGKFSAEFDQSLVKTNEENEPAKEEPQQSSEKDQEAAPPSEETPSEKNPDIPKKEESLLKKPESVQQEVAAFNKRVGGWIYELPKFRVENFAKHKKDLITPQSAQP